MSMNVKWISAEEVRALTDSEGLIIQRLRGDLNEWMDIFNWMLAGVHVLKDGTKFNNGLAFQSDGWNCLLLLFGKNVSINTDELEQWRKQAAGFFHTRLLSDFIED